MGKHEIEAYLSHLATNRKVAASTQRQALNALVFLYKNERDPSSDGKSDVWGRSAPYGVLAPESPGPRFCEIPSVYLLEDGVNIRVVQKLMGHADVKTTEIYTHVMEKDIQAVSSPLETL